MTIEEINELGRYELFDKVLEKIKDKMSIVLTPNNVYPYDRFLIFSACKKQEITFHKKNVPYWIEFDNDEPIRLEDCPDSFLKTILLNIP